MPLDMIQFLHRTFNDPLMCITVFLTLGVIFVNGWTDAPNAIATCVSTRCLPPQAAVFLSAVFNFLGVTVMTAANATVAMTIKNMVNFDGNTHKASIALCAALFAIILWAVTAWAFGIPTSESHALIAGLSGAAIALHNGFSGISGSEWVKVLYGLLLSVGIGLIGGFGTTRLIQRVFRNIDRRKGDLWFRRGQIVGGAAMSFMHGAQDGQKFMGVMLLAMCLSNGRETTSELPIPLWMMLVCSVVMALGTSVGGYKIIKSVGMDMVRPEPYQGFAADLTASVCLFCSSLLGFPVSTTHAKTAAIMGAGVAKRASSVDLRVVRDMALAWVLTFPGCGLIGFLITKLFTWII